MSIAEQLTALGLDPSDLDPHKVGCIQRLRTLEGSRGKRPGWVKIHRTSPFLASLGNWKTGDKGTYAEPTGAKREPVKRGSREEPSFRPRNPEYGSGHKAAAREAWRIWDKCGAPKEPHPYLTRKNVRAYELRQDGEALLVPLCDWREKLWSLQRIFPDGSKRFLKGGRVKGLSYVIGKPDGVLLLAEGYSTAATLHQATGHAVAVCFNAGNLYPAAYELKRRHRCEFVYCADHDRTTEGNPGLTQAREAAKQTGGRVVRPIFRDAVGSDWNDYAHLYGLEAVQEAFHGI